MKSITDLHLKIETGRELADFILPKRFLDNLQIHKNFGKTKILRQTQKVSVFH